MVLSTKWIFFWRLVIIIIRYGTFCTCADGFYNFLLLSWWKNRSKVDQSNKSVHGSLEKWKKIKLLLVVSIGFDLIKSHHCLTCAGSKWRRHCVGVLCLRHHQELSADGRGCAGPTQGIRIHRVRDAPVSNGKIMTSSPCGICMLLTGLWIRKYFFRLRHRLRIVFERYDEKYLFYLPK